MFPILSFSRFISSSMRRANVRFSSSSTDLFLCNSSLDLSLSSRDLCKDETASVLLCSSHRRRSVMAFPSLTDSQSGNLLYICCTCSTSYASEIFGKVGTFSMGLVLLNEALALTDNDSRFVMQSAIWSSRRAGSAASSCSRG